MATGALLLPWRQDTAGSLQVGGDNQEFEEGGDDIQSPGRRGQGGFESYVGKGGKGGIPIG